MITRLDVFEDFISEVKTCIHAALGFEIIRVRYDNDTTFKPDVDETYLRVFLGPTIDESISRSCCGAVVHCESTIEIVTPTKIGLKNSLIIEQCIKNAANDWCCTAYDPNSGYRMITGRDQLSVDSHFTENMSRSVLPVNVKYTITFMGGE